MALSPRAEPSRNRPAQDWAASEVDSWLLPLGEEVPPAKEWPFQTSNVRRKGKSVSVRSQLAYCLATRRSIGPYSLRNVGSVMDCSAPAWVK